MTVVELVSSHEYRRPGRGGRIENRYFESAGTGREEVEALGGGEDVLVDIAGQTR